MRAVSLLLAALPLLTLGAPAAAQTPLGGEIHVTAPYTMPRQTVGEVAMHDDEDFVVVWREPGGDFDEFSDAYVQRFDITGVKAGGRIRVNTSRDFDGLGVDVAHLCGGEFVAAWDLADNNSENIRILAQRFAANGVKIGGEINVVTSAGLLFASIAGDSQCGFTVSWSGGPSGGAHLRRYDAAGQALTGTVQVSQSGDAVGTSISYAPDDSFVVTWTDTTGRDGDRAGVFGRRYASDGTPLGNDFQINTFATEDQTGGAISHAPDGTFVVVWSDRTQDGDDFGAYGQRFTAAGAKDGGEFLIAQTTADRQNAGGISHDRVGGFFVAWTQRMGGSGSDVYARRFALDGTPLSNEFMVNTFTSGFQRGAGVDARRGRVVFAWEDDAQEQPGGSTGIFARRFTTPDAVPALGFGARAALCALVAALALLGRGLRRASG